VRTACITGFSDPEVRGNREASEIVSALWRDALGDHFAWQKLCHAGNYPDARLDQILREPSMIDEPLAQIGKERRAAINGVPQCK
jgi:hypothetical protein